MALRRAHVLAALGGVLLVGGAGGLLLGVPTITPLVLGIVLLVLAALDRWRPKRIDLIAPAGFQPTAERFVDPASREPVRVYANPRTGERRYVRDVARP
jgi:hypothetical protein